MQHCTHHRVSYRGELRKKNIGSLESQGYFLLNLMVEEAVKALNCEVVSIAAGGRRQDVTGKDCVDGLSV